MKKKLRLFVLDPVCAQPFGHNLVALSYFSSFFKKNYDEVFSFCCKSLSDQVASNYGFIRYFKFYYSSYINIDNGEECLISKHSFADDLEFHATEDAKRLLNEFAINNSDTIFFPSLDFYGVIGLLNALKEIGVEKSPQIYLRFIGVMEHASHTYRCPEHELLRRLRLSMQKGFKLYFSAETPKLADYLADKLESVVDVTPYPVMFEPSPVDKYVTFNCLCPGSARLDKGFLLLYDIFKSVRIKDPDLRIRFIVQNLPSKETKQHERYISNLYALPGVTLLPSTITESEMIKYYKLSSIVLLPYDAEIYNLRGSAAMQEAVCFGRPVISFTGTAFSEQISYYRMGKLCSSVDEMADTILSFSNKNREHLYQNMLQSRFRFTSDACQSYIRWFKAK